MARRDRRLYLFDIDGTLIATGGAGGGAMREAFAAIWGIEDGFHGVEFSGRTDRKILRDALMATGLENGAFADDLRRFKRAYFRRLPRTLREKDGRVLPGVVEFLERLEQDSNGTIALGTGNFRLSAGLKLHHYGIGHRFQYDIGGFGDRTEDRASLIASGILAADRGFGRHHTVFVIGDTEHDIAAAKANNVIAVGVATGTSTEEMLAKAGADYVLSTLEEAEQLLPRALSF
jgi:phosphoglycolate phosphatase-like HAD superfamily hydrolase